MFKNSDSNHSILDHNVASSDILFSPKNSQKINGIIKIYSNYSFLHSTLILHVCVITYMWDCG